MSPIQAKLRTTRRVDHSPTGVDITKRAVEPESLSDDTRDRLMQAFRTFPRD